MWNTMAMGRFMLVLLVMQLAGGSFGQAFPIFNGTVNTCVGAFLDSGGEGGAGYGNNENFTYTICPDNPNDAISLNFLTFNLDGTGPGPTDQMTIYDGNSTAAPTLGSYGGNGLEGYVVNASPLNSSGCLTVVFRSNAAGTGIFAASITCYTPCQRPTAVAVMSEAAPAMVCIGEAVTFNSSGSFAAPGFSIATRRWEWGDGTITNSALAVTSHAYAQPGYYQAQLYLIDNNGCASTNRVDLEVLVGTEPTFLGTGGDILGCVGEVLCLDAVVNPVTFNELPSGDLGNGVFLADEVGSCFTAEIEFTQFSPGQTLNSIADLFSICMNMEHSFMGDLVVRIISPTGQTVTMHQQGGGGTFLGVPVDNDATPNAQGTCWQYCFSPTTVNGTWVDNAGGTLASGTYESLNNLNGLVGSQLNGIWQLQICDLWASDNGFVCDWNVNFDPDLFPDLVEFTPVYGTDCDSSSWAGPNVTSTSSDCQGICMTPPGPGVFPYTYTVTDNFGCTYDTTLSITVIPPAIVNAGPDVSTCNTPVPLSASITSGGFPSDCVYQLVLNDSFGDGWTAGSSISVTVNGVTTTHTLAAGTTTTISIPVSHGATVILNYTAATIWNGEQSFTLRNSAGAVVYASPIGPISGNSWTGAAVCPTGAFVYSWTPTTGLSNPNIANPVATVASTTTYCVTAYQPGHPDCPATDCVTITVDNDIDAGTNGSVTVCENSAAVNLFTELGGTPELGGSWTTPSSTPHSGTFMPGTDVSGVYTYSVTGSGACGSSSATSTVTVTVSPMPNAGLNGPLTACSTDGTQNLFAALGGAPMAGGFWTAPGGAAHSGTFNPGTDAAGAYTYTVPGTAPCPPATATITITVHPPPNAGTNGVITLCSSDAAASLFAQLGGSPNAGGTWSGPSAVVGGMIDPATMSAGVYMYTVAGTAPCPDATATVTVTINTPPDPGTNGTITLCSSDAAASLFAQLSGSPDAGGAWSGPSAVIGGMIDPATMSAGVFTYTVAGTAPCPDESATVTVTINTPPNAGTNGTITLCSSDAAASLFAQLGGSPDAGGAWSGPSAVVGGMIDPATMSAGVYTYTVVGTAPCPDESATVTVTINTPPNAGTNGTITLCSSDAAASLFAQLGGSPDAGGAWSGPSAVVGGMIDPATMSAGVYMYTVAGTAPCPNATATVTVTINQAPNAGLDGSLALCITSPAISLFAELNGSPDVGGTWSGPSPVVGGLFNPATMTPGIYVYTVNGTAPCPSVFATVSVNVVTNPDPGSSGAATLCTDDPNIDLFTYLLGTPDAGGTWSGPSSVPGGQFEPGTNLAGVYTYTITVPAPCVSVSSTVTIALVPPPDAGSNGSLTLCISSPPTALLTSLNGSPDADGTWSGPSPVVGGLFNPATMTPGNYVYTVNGTAPCPSASATVTVTVVTNPDPGTPGAATLCTTSSAIDLFATLGGSPDAGGTWSGPSAVVAGQFDPASMSAGVYTYTITVPPPCPSVTSTVTIALVLPPDAGSDGSLTLCISSPATALLPSLNGSPDAGGTWSGPSPVVGGLFNPATMSAGDYVYTVNGTSPCPSASATVTVTVVTNPDPGTPGAATLCTTSSTIDLFATLGGSPDAGGTWSGPSAVVAGQFDPASMSAGVYTYTITVPPPCTSVTSNVTIALVEPPDAGADGSLTLCISSPNAGMLSELNGLPDAGGTWSGPSSVVAGQFNPATMMGGVYTYTVAGTTPCPAASANLTVTVVAAPDAGLPGASSLCVNDSPIDLFEELGGTPDGGGIWSGPSLVVGGQFDPATMAAGVYTYTIIVPPPCVNASSTVTINVIQSPNAGTDGSLVLCISSPAASLFASLGGSPDVGGIWSGPSVVAGGLFDPSTMLEGVYTYTVNGTAPCPADAAASSVTVVSTPDPGGPGFLTACASDAPSDLFSLLEGMPDAGGVWTAPNGASMNGVFDPSSDAPGVYTYTINVPPPCSSVSSTVTVDVVQPPNAGGDGEIVVCATGAAVDLFGVLTGTPDASGTWSGPGGAWTGPFDPTSDIAGTYTYLVAGTAPCPADAATVLVSITEEPYAGQDATLNLCITGDPLDLFPNLNGADLGGSWSIPGGGAFNGTFTPGANLSGAYVYTVAGTAPCPSASATVTVNQLSDPDAGGDGSLTLCSTSGAFTLFAALTGNPDPGGTWLAPNGSTVTTSLDASSAAQGIYAYVLSVPPPCTNDTALVNISIVAAVDAGDDGAIVLCSNDGIVDLFQELEGAPGPGGTWQISGDSSDGTFTPGVDAPGTYVYTIQGTSPCPNSSASVIAEVEPLPNAGTDGAITVCPGSPLIDLFSLLGGSPETGGTWTAPSGSSSDGTFLPGIDPVGVYTYTVYGTIACPDVSASSTVAVFMVPAPQAGPDQIVCSLETTLNATGTWASGIWTGPPGILILDPTSPTSGVVADQGGSYELTWTILTADGCTSLDKVTIVFTDAIIPVATTIDAICFGACDGSAQVNASGGNIGSGGYSYQWSNGVAGNVPLAVAICAGSYTVTVLDTNACSTTIPFLINQLEPLVIDAITTTAETCPGSCDGTLTVLDIEGVSFSIGGTEQASAVFTGLCAGGYTVSMNDVNGCIAYSSGVVGTPPPVIAAFDFSPDTVFVNDPTVDFTNLSSPNAVAFVWNFDGLGSSSSVAPSFTFPGGLGGVYDVCLTAMDTNGCPDSTCLPVEVFDLLIVFVPNAFSPNGDGVNDTFLPIFNLPWVVDYQFLVFNRWGEQIFGTDRPGKPWDGRYSDVVSQEDVYVWKLICKDQLSGERIERIGHVTLLK